MSNTRRLRPPILKKATLYHCQVCRQRFHTPAARHAHWKFIAGGRICQPQDVMIQRLGLRWKRGAWELTTEARPRA